MFETSLKLGKNLLESSTSDTKKKDMFLISQAIIPQPVDDDKATGDREIVIDLDTKIGEIDIYLGGQLIPQNRDTFFAFELLGKRSKKIYFATNNLYYHLISLDEIITYIQDNMDNRYPKFADFLIGLRQQFYLKDDENGWTLNPDNLKDDLRKRFNEYSDENTRDAFEEFVSKEVLGSTRKGFVKNINICTLKINGVRAHEKGFPFNKEYVDIVYYERQKRFFDNSESMVQENAACSGCNKQRKVTGKIDIPTKFYITDKPTFFEELNDNNAYRSFALCEQCYQALMVGIDHVKNKYTGRLFGTNYYLVPQSPNVENLDEKMIVIKDILAARSKNMAKEFKTHSDLIEGIKYENLRFDFLFHWTPPGQGAAFVVAEYISDVEYRNLDSIFATVRGFESGFYSAIGSIAADLNHIYWLLFPNKDSHSNPDPDLYRKELLHIFKVLLKDGVLQYRSMLNKFLFIYRKTEYRKQQKDFSFLMRPLQMHMLLSLFYKHTNLHGLNIMDTQQEFTEIPNKKVLHFFETHYEVYQNNLYRQGLVLLGLLMNQILKKQNKQDKSSTILNKLNFDGMPVKRLPQFVNEINEYLRIYNVYHLNQLMHASMMDRLQNIEDSSVSKDEVVFYIMTGISLSSYLGYQYNQEQQMEVNTNE